MLALVPLLIVALLVLFVATSSFKIVGQAEVMVIERLGRFHRIAHSGLNVLIPFVERLRAIDVRYLSADVTGLKKITAQMTADQKSARATFERIGFRPEALLADHVVDSEGRTHDMLIMSYDIDGFND